MSTGSPADIAARMRAVMPLGWFPAAPGPGEVETAPVLVAVLTGIGTCWSTIWSLLGYLKLQTRLATTTGTNLELTAQDYFGPGAFPRQGAEGDTAYAARIKAARLPQRATRPALVAAVTGLTGQAPNVIEFMNAADTKGYGSLAAPAIGGGYGYGTPGVRYGSLLRPFQALVAVEGGSAVPTATTYATIASNLPVGTIAWTDPAGS